MDAAIKTRRRLAITCIRKSRKEGVAGHDALADPGCAKPASEPEMLGAHLPSGRLSALLHSLGAHGLGASRAALCDPAHRRVAKRPTSPMELRWISRENRRDALPEPPAAGRRA